MDEVVVIIGAGGFGRETLDVLRAQQPSEDTDSPRRFVGFLDDGSPDAALLARLDAEHLGPVEHLAQLPGARYLIGVGDPKSRQVLDEKAAALGAQALSAVHHRDASYSDVQLGPGTVVTAGVRLTNNIRVGRHVHLNLNCTVGHDAVLGDYVTVNPLASISGNVRIGDRVMIGTGANIIQGVTIGDDAVIGAGAVVLADIAAGITAVGVPARPLQG